MLRSGAPLLIPHSIYQLSIDANKVVISPITARI